MLQLEELNANKKFIDDLTGLEFATNLKCANLSQNKIRLVRYVLSSENIDLFAPLMDEKTLEGARMISAAVSKMPVGTVALVAGTDENLVPFLQLALALPAELQPKLNLIESGQAKASLDRKSVV